MSRIQLVADSTCDLSQELIQKYHIAIIPLYIVIGDARYYDGEEITPYEIFQFTNNSRNTPKTAPISYERTFATLKPFVDAGDDIIFIGISEKMSETCKIVRKVAMDLDYENLYVIDSQNVSTGIGVQLLYAAELIATGMDADEIVDLVKIRRNKVNSSFVVDTLTYLAKGGRCNSATALFGNAFKIKPQINVERGSMDVTRNFHGKQEVVIMKYVEELTPALLAADSSCIFITHSFEDSSIVKNIEAYLSTLHYFEKIYITHVGGVISSHCGPNTLGLLFYSL